MVLEFRHGYLLEVLGRPRSWGGVWFVPACADIDGPGEHPSHFLRDYAPIAPFWEDDFDLGDADAPWVRAALQGTFRYAPLHVADAGRALLDAAFVAVLLETDDSGVAYPFACTDAGPTTGLVFSRAGPEAPVRDRIAEAFWGLLLAEGAECLAEFVAERVAFDMGGGDETEVEIGYARGRFYVHDLLDPLDE